MATAPVITIFVRHSADCKETDAQFKRCDCRKHFRWFANGKQQFKTAGTRKWNEAEKAKRLLEDQLAGVAPQEAVPSAGVTLGDAAESFLAEKRLEHVAPGVLHGYKLFCARLERYCASRSVFTIGAITQDVLVAYMATWEEMFSAASTRNLQRMMLSTFLNYCERREWIRNRKVFRLPRFTDDGAVTTPLTDAEFARLLSVVPQAVDADKQARLRCLFLLMRWTGLAVRDALTLPKAELHQQNGSYRIVTARQKTGTHVSVPVPPFVAKELLALTATHPDYFFFDGEDGAVFTNNMARHIRKAFELAGLNDGQQMKSHRLRDTFAVDLLQKGVPLEDVSKLLGHTSIKTTEKHYAKWVKGRQDRLDSLVMSTWA